MTRLDRLSLSTLGWRLLLVSAISLLTSCNAREAPNVPAGNPERGRELIQLAGCGSCHQIPGVAGANGRVGPPLNRLARRAYLAGILPNNFDNLVTWLRNPREIAPKTAMPDTGLNQSQAEDVAAYLYQM